MAKTAHIRLPRDWTGGAWLDGTVELAVDPQRTIELPLGRYGTAQVWSRPVSRPDVRLFPGREALCPLGYRRRHPATPRPLWQTDWAGRPLYPLAGAGIPPLLPDDAAHPFIDANWHWRVDGPFPAEGRLNAIGQIFRIFPGGVFRYEIHVPGPLKAISWHDNTQALMGEELRARVRLQPLAAMFGRSPRYAGARRLDGTPQGALLTVSLPAQGTYNTGRDHLLAMQLQTPAATEERVLRFRIEPAVRFRWDWTAPDAGRCVVEPRFPARFYRTPPEEWGIEVAAEGLSVVSARVDSPTRNASDTDVGKPLATDFAFTVPPGATEDRLVSLQATVAGKGEFVAGGTLDRVWVGPEGIERGSDAKSAVARPVQTPGPDALWEAWWQLTTGLQPCRHFLNMGSRSFVSERYQAWMGYDEARLYWYMELPARLSHLRADATGADPRFFGDDLAVLMLRLPESGQSYILQLNAAGAAWHARVEPRFDLAWNPDLSIRTQRGQGAWRLICSIPWADLGLDRVPAELRVNLATATSIAPRQRASWHYWGQPFDAGSMLAPLRLEP